eukprot:5538670-Pyramimonas_sp.AAC.1
MFTGAIMSVPSPSSAPRPPAYMLQCRGSSVQLEGQLGVCRGSVGGNLAQEDPYKIKTNELVACAKQSYHPGGSPRRVYYLRHVGTCVAHCRVQLEVISDSVGTTAAEVSCSSCRWHICFRLTFGHAFRTSDLVMPSLF